MALALLDSHDEPPAATTTANALEYSSLTFLFSDVVGFTRMTERLGDSAAHRVMARHRAFVAETARRHGGETVEVRGDGFLLAFASACSAVHCAIALQSGLACAAHERPAEAISVRTGLHTGPAIADEGFYFGRNVILAARVAERAEPDEILVSAELRELLRGRAEFRTGAGRRVSLKGFAERQQVFALSWAGEPALAAATGW